MTDLPSDNRNIVYMDGDDLIFRASAFGSCTKALALAVAGEEPSRPPEQLQMVYDAGHEAEDRVVELIRADGLEINNRQAEIDLELSPGVLVRSHIDGETELPSDRSKGRVVEIKSQSNDAYNSWTPDAWTTDPLWQKYAWQISVAMIAWGVETVLVRFNRDTEQYDIHVIEYPFHSRDEFQQRAADIIELADSPTLRESICPESYGCPYFRFHSLAPMTTPIIDLPLQHLATNYLYWATAEKDAKETKEVQKQQIIARLRELDLTKVALPDGTTISYTETEVPASTREVKAYTQTRLTVKKGSGNEV